MRFIELPPILSGARTWGARVGNIQFVIAHEDGSELRPEDRVQWVGYTATYLDLTAPSPRTMPIKGLWQNFAGAERACLNAWKRLRRKQ